MHSFAELEPPKPQEPDESDEESSPEVRRTSALRQRRRSIAESDTVRTFKSNDGASSGRVHEWKRVENRELKPTPRRRPRRHSLAPEPEVPQAATATPKQGLDTCQFLVICALGALAIVLLPRFFGVTGWSDLMKQ